MGLPSINDWTVDRLTKHIRNQRIGPAQLPPSLGLKELSTTGNTGIGGKLDVTGKLGVNGALSLSASAQQTVKGLWSGVGVKLANVLTGTRRNINFIAGSNVTITQADDSTNDKVDVTINATVPTTNRRLAYDKLTGTVNITGTSEATATTIITGSSFTADGSTPVLVEVYIPKVIFATSGVDIVFVLFRDGSVIGQIGEAQESTTDRIPFFGAFSETPASGSHQYTLKAWSGGAGSVIGGNGGSGTFVPGYIRVVKDN